MPTTLEQHLADLATAVGAETKAIRLLLNNNSAAGLAALSFGTKMNLVASLNELAAMVANASAINDTTLGTATSWSSQKTSDSIAAAIAAIVNGAPTALDTLKELADKLAADDTALSALVTGLSTRVDTGAAQSFTSAQQKQGRDNIGAAAAADIGNADRDLVAVFNAARV